jgi:subtilisin family serine protease
MKSQLPKSSSNNFTSAINMNFSFFKVLTTVLILTTTLSFAQNNSKIAPAFLYLIDHPMTKENEKTYPKLFKLTAVNGVNPKTGKYENGYICIIYTKYPEVLKANGIAIQSTYPTYVTAWVTLSQIPKIADLNEVTFIDAPQMIMPNNDISLGTSGASLLHAGKVNNTVYKGDGVIVAIVDTGIDWDHPDFRNSADQTKSRILRIWDQTLTPISGEVSPTGFNYGVEYTQNQINNEIDGSPVGFVREVDTNGHGTHVAGTAAGNGAALSTFKYRGLAPNADLVIVKAGNGSFTSTNIINSLTYLQNLATTLGKPIVVNMSLGGQSSAHDGTDPQEIAVDAFSNAAPGRVVVIAAGNDNGIDIHKQNSIASSGSTSVSLVVPTASASTSTDVFQYTCYANDASAIHATITAPGGTSATVQANAYGGFSIMGGLATVYFSNFIDAGSGDRQINVYLVRASTTASVSGTWTLTLNNATTNTLTIDGWLNYKGNDFATTTVTSGDSNYLVATPGCANNAITVGSYMAKMDWSSANGTPYSYPSPSQQDNISSFSSIGPRRDNIQKPDITANGQAVVSCLSSDSGLTYNDPYMVVNGLYRVEQGTSMATPEVTGCVALLLQINKNATYSQIKTALKSTATKDAFTTAFDNNIWGSGKVDVFKAASSQLYCNTLNRVTYSYDASYTATNNLQVNLGALKATTRFTPTISGQLGGVYFKTGSVVTLTSFTIEVRTNSLGIPGTLLNSLTVTPSSVSKYSWNYYDLSSLNIPVTSGTDYFIVLVPGAGSTLYLGQDPDYVGRSFYFNGVGWIAQYDFRIRTVVYTTGNLVPSVALSSATGTNAQTKCINTALNNITYATTGASGATFSGLPPGVTGSWASNIVTISGTPTVAGTYNYIVTLTGGCSTSVAGTIIVNAMATATSGGPTSVCQSASPTAFALAGASVGGSATTGAWSIVSGGGTLSSTAQTATPATVTYTPEANYTGLVTLRLTSYSGTGCSAASADRVVNVILIPILSANTGGALSVQTNASTTAFVNPQVGGIWSIVPGTGTASITSNGVVTGLTAGTVSVLYTFTNDCGTSTTSNTVTVISSLSGIISGNATVCAGTATQLSIALTGECPWFGTLSDGTGFSGSDNPLLVTVTPSQTTAYTIATLSSETATASATDLSGSAAVTVNQPTIWYADTDLDTFGDLATSQSVCEQPSDYVANSTDCDPIDGTKWQLATFYVDADADGFTNGTASVCSGVSAPTGYATDSTGTDCDDHVFSLSNNCTTASIVNLKFYIQGYYSGSQMMTSVKWNQDYESPETDVADMIVELHDSVTYALVDTAIGTLKTDGTLSVTFNTAAPGSYYIAVKGSNLVQTWSAAPQEVGITPLSFDFSTSASQAYGDNMVEIESGIFAMYQGDLAADDLVDLTDYSVWEAKYSSFAFGVEPTDLNGDGLVDLTDYSIWEANYSAFIFAVYPF